MELQSAGGWLQCHAPTVRLSPCQRFFSLHAGSSPYSLRNKISRSCLGMRDGRLWLQQASNSYLLLDLRKRAKDASKLDLNAGIVCAYKSNPSAKLNFDGKDGLKGMEPFRGKSGSVSFYGLTHQLVEEGKLVSAPFKEGTGSLLWVLAPVALISSLVLPQFFLPATENFFKDEILSEIVASLSSEIMFYVGLGTFLLVTDHVQKPYLQFSAKRWGLITGLKGFLTSAFFTMGFKVVAPLLAAYVTWPVLGLPAFISVAPFLASCLAQYLFETCLDKRNSSCWPLVPIIFEVYRLYQLTKAAHFIERLMFAMRGSPISPEVLERSGALVAMIVAFQVLGMVCLWSLVTFLLRLFPSRPVAEKY